MNLSSDVPFRHIVNVDEFKLIRDLVQGLGLEHACGYHQHDDESWLRIDQNGRHMIFIVQGIKVSFGDE